MSKIAVITGGSRGIGAATALLAAEKGYAVCVNYRENHEAAERVVAKISGQGGRVTGLRRGRPVFAPLLFRVYPGCPGVLEGL